MCISLLGCTSLKKIPELKGRVVEGQILDGDSNEAIIGINVGEYEYMQYSKMTDINGFFEIKFKGEIPVIVLSGGYAPIYAKVNPETFNKIIINGSSYKKSNKLIKEVEKLKGEK